MANVTFMIGNGFDLACGLKSRYTDSYQGYIDSPSSSDVIKRFKNAIEKDINTWADFEMKMAEYAKNFNSEAELVECISDYKNYLNKYLEKEQRDFLESHQNNDIVRSAWIKEMHRSLTEYYSMLIPNDKHTISLSLSDNYPIQYQFINFNYTNVLDILLDELSDYWYKNNYNYIYKPPVIHIHGRLGNDLTLGVDNEAQISNLPYPLSFRGKRRIIKKSFIEGYDITRKEDAISFIQSSDSICVFGLSLGESDLTWRLAITDWLLSNPNHHLVFFNYNLATKPYFSVDIPQKMDDEEDEKEKLINLLISNISSNEIHTQIFSQVHIPTGSNIFDFQNIVIKEIKGVNTAHPYIMK